MLSLDYRAAFTLSRFCTPSQGLRVRNTFQQVASSSSNRGLKSPCGETVAQNGHPSGSKRPKSKGT